jgi:two-component system, NtrC family, response regulator HydG
MPEHKFERNNGVRQPAIVLVDDEECILDLMKMMLLASGHDTVHTFTNGADAVNFVVSSDCGAVVLDIDMPGMSGIEVLRRLKEEKPFLCVIMATGDNEVATAVKCMRAGAFDYIVKPIEQERLLASIANALHLQDVTSECEALSERMLADSLKNPGIFEGIVTKNPKMFTIFKYVEAISHTPHPVLITGETGTGKELIARAVHKSSGVSGLFVAVNAAGLDDTMFSDSLFGHIKGAFTGADAARQGFIERAAGGTLFLDEIGDLCVQSQIKLLRLIQEREYYPVGSDTARRCTARIVTATCHDVYKLHSDGRMRNDLFYRLQTHHIHLPPLRERKEDIEPLLKGFIAAAAAEMNKPRPAIPSELVTLLSTWHFPGNIRELESMARDAVGLHAGRIMSTKSFRQNLGMQAGDAPAAASAASGCAEDMVVFPPKLPTLDQVDFLLVKEAMARANGNQSIAAQLLGITRQSLSYRLKKGQ